MNVNNEHPEIKKVSKKVRDDISHDERGCCPEFYCINVFDVLMFFKIVRISNLTAYTIHILVKLTNVSILICKYDNAFEGHLTIKGHRIISRVSDK